MQNRIWRNLIIILALTAAASNENVSLDTATGTVSVAPQTPAGTYTIAYQICEILNPGNCDTATATVVVDAPAIVANNDDWSSTVINGNEGQVNAGNGFRKLKTYYK